MVHSLHGGEGDGAEDAVFGNPDGLLEPADGLGRAGIHGGVEKLEGESGVEFFTPGGEPVGGVVNSDSLFPGHEAHFPFVAIFPGDPGGDAPHGFAAGVEGVIRVPPFMGEDAGDGFLEGGGIFHALSPRKQPPPKQYTPTCNYKAAQHSKNCERQLSSSKN